MSLIATKTQHRITEKENPQLAVCLPSLLQEVEPHLNNFNAVYTNDFHDFELYLFDLELVNLPDVMIIEIDAGRKCFEVIKKIRTNFLLKGIIIILLATDKNTSLEEVKKMKVHDVYCRPINFSHLRERIIFLVRFKLIKPRIEDLGSEVITDYKMPLYKRLFDILFSGTLILLLIPVFLVTALLLKTSSKGPVIYKSKRVGTGYKIFNFLKFRSMRIDADKQLVKLSELNQYNQQGGADKSAFMKFKNDPRVTPIGRFLRKTSIDELPQLFNILKGDMSTVGNRPLPLYEAEMLTSNDWALRFLAPAGLTGLWQVSKRGREDMSERERKKLDNFYAQKYSFWLDMKILFGTIPALFQKEKV